MRREVDLSDVRTTLTVLVKLHELFNSGCSDLHSASDGCHIDKNLGAQSVRSKGPLSHCLIRSTGGNEGVSGSLSRPGPLGF